MKRIMCAGIIGGLVGFTCLAPIEPMEIKHPLIGLMDGTARVQMHKIDFLKKSLMFLQQGDSSKREAHVTINKKKPDEKTIALHMNYKGMRVNLKDLVLEEKKSGSHSFELASTFTEGFEKFVALSDPYLQENRGFKSQMCAIIERWAKLRKRPNTQLLEWANVPSGMEYEHMKKKVTTFKEFDEFITDLITFLGDMQFSCKKSWHAYMIEYNKTHGNNHKEL